jgi:hypothetical protein
MIIIEELEGRSEIIPCRRIAFGNVRIGSFTSFRACPGHFRLSPDSGHIAAAQQANATANGLLLDRLTHRCEIVKTGNDSWPFKSRDDDHTSTALGPAPPTNICAKAKSLRVRRTSWRDCQPWPQREPQASQIGNAALIT